VVLVKRALWQQFPDIAIEHVETRDEYVEQLGSARFDLILSDGSIPGCEGIGAYHLAREQAAGTPFIYISGFDHGDRDMTALRALGVHEFVSKSDLNGLGGLIRKALERQSVPETQRALLAGHERLSGVARFLLGERDVESIAGLACRLARQVTGASGAALALREGSEVHFIEEDGPAPLFKGQRFPLDASAAGWSILNRQPAVVENIFADVRVRPAAFEPTFARSALVAPIRALDPVGAIEVYWPAMRSPEAYEVQLLQSLADLVAVALDRVTERSEMENRIRERTRELESFNYAVSHDLRAPVRHVRSFTQILAEDHAEALPAEGRRILERVANASRQLGEMIEGLLALSRVSQAPLERETVDLATLARDLAGELDSKAPKAVSFTVPETLPADLDRGLARNLLQQLLGNAWKFTGKREAPCAELGQLTGAPVPTYFVRDNGAGFNPAHSGKLFAVFQRLHTEQEFPGIGVGLAIAKRVVTRHGGRIWAESVPGKGTTVYFTLSPEASTTTA
jgi:signal transduction histidine kinase